MPAFIVVEAGVNHLGDRAKMLAFCDAAKACGADAVKFQAYNAVALVKRRAGSGDLKLLKKCELSDADLDAISAHCEAIGSKWGASVFDLKQPARCWKRGASFLKIGHAENKWKELNVCASDIVYDGPRYGSLYVSFHPSQWKRARRTNGQAVLNPKGYPCRRKPRLELLGHSNELSDATIGWDERHERPIVRKDYTPDFEGFSSHFKNYRIPAAAALRGAEYIEAHLKLSDSDPEAAWSLSVGDFTKMVKLAREYESWL